MDSSYKSNIIIEGYKLPTGGVYSGEAIDNQTGFVELSGKGKATSPDGSTYDGSWKYSRPYGFGIYKFADGDFHKGFFDDKPNGPGYLCLNTKRSMVLGFFRDGVSNGWAISINSRGDFNCSFLKNGKVIQDHTADFQGMSDLLSVLVFNTYSGNMIQCSEENGYIRFGAPDRTGSDTYTNGRIVKYERHAIGFLFSTDGNLYIGRIKNKNQLLGYCVKCTQDHRIISGLWENNELIKELSIKDVTALTEHELQSECIHNIIDDGRNNKEDLPF